MSRTLRPLIVAIITVALGMTGFCRTAMPNVAAQQSVSVHSVQRGETLSGIAKRYGTTVSAIKQANFLSGSLIYPGQRLTILSQASSSTAGSARFSTSTSSTNTYYIVRAGETLSGIAARHGTTVSAFKQANGLSNDQVRVGQALTIPSSASSGSTGRAAGDNVPATPRSNSSGDRCASSYVVQSGDSLARIADRCGVSQTKLMADNDLGEAILWRGQLLSIPDTDSDSGLVLP